jgi:hypothetical protein
MATIYANYDGYVGRINQSNWANARNSGVGTASSATSTAHTQSVSAYSQASRGGGTTTSIQRSFFVFDTSGISSTVDSATLKIMGANNTSGDLIVLKATSAISSLSTADFNSIDGWAYNTTDGSGGGDQSGNVTAYSSEVSTWNKYPSAYNEITLNAQAKSDMENNDDLYIALVNYDYDLLDIDIGTGSAKNGLYFENYTGTSRDPYIDYEVAEATITHNATFFGSNF